MRRFMNIVSCVGALAAVMVTAGFSLAEDRVSAPASPPVELCEPQSPCCRQAPGRKYWGSADYLLGWVKKGPTPPLVTTGPTNVLFSGSLDVPSTRVLFGDERIGYGTQSGWRAFAGAWLDKEQRLGLEIGGFQLFNGSNSFSLSGGPNGQQYIARPFIDALTGNPNVYFVSQNFSDPSLSAFMTGAIGISSSSKLWGWEANTILGGMRGNGFRADLLAGFRWLDLREDLRINENFRNLQAGGGAFFLGSSADLSQSVSTFDSFNGRNRFYGGQLGGRLDWQRGAWNVGLVGKVALGVTHQEVIIEGTSALLNSAGTAIAAVPGGVLAVSSNMGNRTSDRFAVVPELGINLGYDITSQWRAHIGYNFMYWSSVVRPGDQIDLVVNPRRVPTDGAFGVPGGPVRPLSNDNRADFWAQMLNFGLEFRF